MYDDLYHETFEKINQLPCLFEKSINATHCRCKYAHRFFLADRQGIACTSSDHQKRCQQFQHCLNPKVLFVLKLTTPEMLTHAKELRIQSGAIFALAKINQDKDLPPDIDKTLTLGIEQFQSFDNFPFEKIVQGIATQKVKKRKKRKID